MYDVYEYTVMQNNLFIAGYKHCVINTQAMSCYLFTTLRIIRVVRGVADWKIGNKIFQAKTGDLIVVNNIETRQVVRVEEAFECEIFAFLPTVFGGDNSCMRLFYNRANGFRPILEKELPYFNNVNNMLDLLVDIFREDNCNEQRVMICSILTAVVSQIIWGIEKIFPEILCAENNDNYRTAQLIAKTIEFINENINTEFNVIDLAMQMHLSRGHLNRLFHHYIGETPAAFINRCRITNVIRLLESSNRNILDCALDSGFGSSSGFYKTFRAVCGMSPKEYMEKRHKT